MSEANDTPTQSEMWEEEKDDALLGNMESSNGLNEEAGQ